MDFKQHIQELNALSYEVTQNKKTEPPFQNAYYDHFEPGLYLDIVSKVPLFSSKHKFKCSCGWPSFYKALDENQLEFIEDTSHGMQRTEVIAKLSKSHLGHLFDDGPIEHGSQRYCINSAALTFIPLASFKDDEALMKVYMQ